MLHTDASDTDCKEPKKELELERSQLSNLVAKCKKILAGVKSQERKSMHKLRNYLRISLARIGLKSS